MSDPTSRSAKRRRILVVYGTRPEAIKLAPVVRELRGPGDLDVIVGVTAQHRKMLDDVNAAFDIVPQHDLDLLSHGQTLAQLTERALPGVVAMIQETAPDAVLVQGDTTTTFVGALAAFYEQVPLVHVEAGLRTGDRRHPFPEEVNRRLTTQLTDLHLAPTPQSRANLEREGILPGDVVVTGNTVVDALIWTLARPVSWSDPLLPALLLASSRTVLVTAHRRESWGGPMAEVADAVATLARRHPDVGFVLPAHPNPVVREVLEPRLARLPNVMLTEPLPYPEFCHLLAASDLLITDSGGLQEEGPSLGKPVLVTRETTERPEGLVNSGVALVGCDHNVIVAAAEARLSASGRQPAQSCRHPYGDGRAAERAAAAIRCLFGSAQRLPDFKPTHS